MITGFMRIRFAYRARVIAALGKAHRHEPLTLADRAVLFLADMAGWAEARFTLADMKKASARKKRCLVCERWRRSPVGHCAVCGCTGAKWWVSTARCPLGFWE